MYILNEDNLTDDTFLPKSYAARLEKRMFKTAAERTVGPVRPWRQPYVHIN